MLRQLKLLLQRLSVKRNCSYENIIHAILSICLCWQS